MNWIITNKLFLWAIVDFILCIANMHFYTLTGRAMSFIISILVGIAGLWMLYQWHHEPTINKEEKKDK